ncbi:MAG: 4Fe-4S cluster-binding domain-containing protein [Candidatus Bathyarchaeota archaeon]|nr:MAG: 4Fe-4S cluster-binding domain-containing protein [Candidatus Bathyarchaeota archaeon]
MSEISQPHIIGGVNLYLTNLCNRRCPYCYALDWITADAQSAHHMSLSSLDKVIDWMNQSSSSSRARVRMQFRNVQLLGGEPMLHPDILGVVRKLTERGIAIRCILTNGLADTELYEKVMAMTETSFLVNVTNPSTYTGEEWELLNRNLELLMWKDEDRLILDSLDRRSFLLQLAITFYEPKQEYRYIIDLAKKYNCIYLRYSSSKPSTDKSNRYNEFEKLIELKPTLLSFLKDCVQEGIKPTLECVLIPCIFTTREWIYLNHFSEYPKTICQPNLEVMPDLSVECCMSTRGILRAYKVGSMNISEMMRLFYNNARKYRDYSLPRCKNCEIFKRKECQGYCLRLKADHVKKSWWSIF